MTHKRPGPGYAGILGLLLLWVLVVPVAAGTGTWTTTGPFATGLGNQVVYALAISPDGSVVYCGTGSGSVFSFTYGIAPPIAGFSGTPVSGITPLSVTFSDTSTNTPAMWNWSFGDGTWFNTSSYSERNPVHTYSSGGTFTVSLTVTNALGSDTLSRTGYVSVSGPPTARFSADVTSGTAPLAVRFSDTSDAVSPLMWNWSFGDNTWFNTTAGSGPVHTYTSAGSYTVALTVTNATGSDTSTKSGYITVSSGGTGLPTASFTGTPTSGTAPLPVTFSDSSLVKAGTMWNWSFGDNTWSNTSARSSPVHTYTTAGSYTVSLTVTNASGSDTATEAGYIHVTSGGTGLPTASFAGTPTSGTAPLQVTFSDSSLVTAGTMWNWSFGDNTGSNTSASSSPVHTYTTAGSYTVSLTVTNASGSDTRTRPGYITVMTLPVTTATTAPVTTTTTAPVTTVTTSPVTTATTSAAGTGADDSGDPGRDTSYAVTAPGTGAGGTMTFAVNEPLSAGGTGYSYAITAVSLVPAQALGSTSLLVTDAGSTSHAPNGRTVAGIVAISPVAVNPSSISSGTIAFEVSGAWLSAHGLTPADIVLMRYHDGIWAELPTTYQYEAGGADYYTATTPGFSYFAIANRAGTVSANATVTGTAAASNPVSTTQAVVVTSPAPASMAAPAGTSAPVTTATTAVPAGATGSSGIPVLTILAGIGGIAILAVGTVLVRRWWIRRQNPALFKDYD